MKKHLICLITLTLSAFLLCACGGGGNSDEDTAMAGFYTGTLESQGGPVLELTAFVAPDGTVKMISTGNIVYAGNFQVDGNYLWGTFKGIAPAPLTFSGSGTSTTEGTIEGTIIGKDSIQATYVATGEERGTISLAYDPSLSEIPLSQEDLQGNWGNHTSSTEFIHNTIDGSLLSGIDDAGCNLEAQISIPNNALNLFNVQMEFTGCQTIVGSYSGMGIMEPGTDGDTLRVIFNNDVKGLENRWSFYDAAWPQI